MTETEKSNTSAHVLLNLLSELRKRDKMEGFAKHLITFLQQVIHSLIQEHN